MSGSAPSEDEINQLTSRYKDLRNAITKYLSLINENVHNFDFSVKELFCEVSWLREQARWLFGDQHELDGLDNLPSRKSLTSSEAKLGVPLATRRALVEKWEKLSNHPLYGLIPHPEGETTAEPHKILTEWAAASRQLTDAANQLSALLSDQRFYSYGALKSLTSMSALLTIAVCEQFNVKAIFSHKVPINDLERLVATEEELSAINEEADFLWQFEGTTPEEIGKIIQPVHKRLWIKKIDLNLLSADQIVQLQTAL